jgi:hypothetical protein
MHIQSICLYRISNKMYKILDNILGGNIEFRLNYLAVETQCSMVIVFIV